MSIQEGTFAFHTIKHNHSFHSTDCTSKLIKKFYGQTFSCARTKCEGIVINVFKNYCDDNLENDLSKASYVTLLSDASNHHEIKLYPILVRYFNIKDGVKVQLLNMESITSEISEYLTEHISMSNKILAISADNTNLNFGGLKRRGINNVHKKLINKFQRNIIGVGCNVDILSNTINTASSSLSIDVEITIPQIYLCFHCFTVRVASLEILCEEAAVEYRKLLGFSKVRWLALLPAIERVLKLYKPLKSYFLSIDKYPKVLNLFLNDEIS